VHFATIGWVLHGAHDPDGHEVRFYTTEHNMEISPDGPIVVENPREAAAAREAAYLAGKE
jgi:hypothetical protein